MTRWMPGWGVAALAALFLLAGCDGGGKGGAGDQEDHAGHDGHEGEGGHDEHAGEAEEDHVLLSPAAAAEAGLVLGSPGPGRIEIAVDLPGEVIADPDLVAHVTPRAAGTVLEVGAVLGARVKRGDVLAVIESPELGAAKIGYLEALRTLEIARFDHARRKEVGGNIERLLALLAEEPEPGEIRRKAVDLVIGEDKARLLTTWSNLRLAARNRDREEELSGRGINSESELLAARNALDAASAEYASARETVAWTHRALLLDAERALRLAEATLQDRERRLHLLGVPEQEVAGLGEEPDDRIARTSLRSPIDGVVVEKHLVLGENVDTTTEVFVVVDLARVLMRYYVPPGELGKVREGLKVRVRVDGVEAAGEGRVDFLSPVVQEETRMAECRTALPNPDGRWRPGLFGSVRIVLEEAEVSISLPLESLFRHEGGDVVFVEEAERTYEPRPVRLGRRDGVVVEVLEGVKPGDRVVVGNGFILKAELGKGAGGHDH